MLGNGEAAMSWRALVQSDFIMGGIAIHLGERYADQRMRIVQPVDLITEMVDRPIATDPALRITDELGRALLDALAAHYGGAVDARTSREDLLTERRRSDRLIEALISVATPQRPA